MGDPDVVRLNSVVKRYRGIVALNQVSIRIGRGITGLLGPNGAGKSTLIKILMGLVRITRGEGTVLGFPIGRHGRKIRSRVGYMPEDDCYIAGMSGIEMVRFSAALAGLPFVEGLRRSHEILDFCGVQQERYRPVDDYSTGMRQKIKFAAAIVHDPQFLILDEPTSGLDPEERQSLLNRIRVLSQQFHKSILLSTHILPDVQHVCDHVIILSEGTVRISDSLASLNRTASPTVNVRVLEGQEVLHSELMRMGLGAALRDDGGISVTSPDAQLAEKVWATCSRLGLTVQSLTPAKTSLEEVFFGALSQEANNAHS